MLYKKNKKKHFDQEKERVGNDAEVVILFSVFILFPW